MTEEESTVITRERLLFSRDVVLQKQQSEPLDPCRLKAETRATPFATPFATPAATPFATPAPSPAVRPAPPPGLELPDAEFELTGLDEAAAAPEGVSAEPGSRPRASTEPALGWMAAPEPENFKVLMSNLPEAMLNECMIRAMLEQARLADVEALAFRKGGKCLVTFSNYASAYKCITHVHGRKWGNSPLPVHALYVRTVKRCEQSEVPRKVSADTSAFEMSATAPAFVPGCALALPTASKALSAAAPVFVMPAQEAAEKVRDRFLSYASTEAGDYSDEVPQRCDSDSISE